MEKEYLKPTPFSETDLLAFLEFLRDRLNVDFTGYSQASVNRRLTRILHDMGVQNLPALREKLIGYPDLRTEFIDKFTVNVTEMFRDPSFWRAVVEHVFPVWKEREFVKVWSAGCSTGEEIYTLMILLEEHGLRNKVKILGTDLNESVMHKAKKGRIGTRHYKDYQKAYQDAGGKLSLDRYFIPTSDDHMELNLTMIGRVEFRKLDLVLDEIPGQFDMILCRNVFIYFSPALQDLVLSKFITAMFPQAFFGLGSKESILFCRDRSQLVEVVQDERLYRKIS